MSSQKNNARKKKGARRNRGGSADPVSALANLDAATAQEFQAKFRELAKEEAKSMQGVREDRWLRAHGVYGKPDMRVIDGKRWIEGIPEEVVKREGYTFATKEECGYWELTGGTTEGIRARFKALATDAGSRLGVPQGATAFECWMHGLFLDLREKKSSYLRGVDDSGGLVERVIEASADFCARMEAKAIESAAAKEQKATQGAIVVNQQQAGKKKATQVSVLTGLVADWKRKQPGITAEELCRKLDDQSVSFPKRARWRNHGVRSWEDARRKQETAGAVRAFLSSIKV